ncbi:MAG TPA: TRAP transporter small permease [Candidatus Methylomirabilis sp.]|nr:TRAP transporter small permease [Candidatus Methylomirabilis sp.]HSC71645.1 TRAP transporter small permease [Candidatus Methylomirabilis sp.]
MSPLADPSSHGLLCRVDRILAAALRWVSTICLAALGVLVCALVLVRFFPIVSLDWSDEIVELAFAWMVFMGTAAVWRNYEHITIDFIPQALAATRTGRVLEAVISLLALGFLSVFTWQGLRLTLHAQDTSPMLALPRRWWYASVPVSGVVMIGYSVSRLLRMVSTCRQT